MNLYRSAKSSLKSMVVKLKSFSFSQFMTAIRRSQHHNTEKATQARLDVLVFGSSNVDYITYVNELPKPGETLHGLHREQCFGGKGANQCVAAAKLGGACALISKLGDDKLGEEYLHYLQSLGINVDFVERMKDMRTGLAEITVSDNAENTIIVLAGANVMLKSKDATAARKLFKNANVLLCQLETEEKAVLCALQQFKGTSILNASPIPKDMNKELIKAPTILCVNEVEAAQLTDREKVETLQDAKEAANELIDKGAQSVIITMGSQGAVHLASGTRDKCYHCPAAPVRFLADTSGAGDAFLGSLAYHISRYPNLNRESHIYAANFCAAYAVGHRGTQPSFPGPDGAQTNLCKHQPAFFEITDEYGKPAQESTSATTATPPETTPAATPTPAETKQSDPKAQATQQEVKESQPTAVDAIPEEKKTEPEQLPAIRT